MNRRELLGIVPLAALAACSKTSAPATQMQTWVGLIAAGAATLASVLPTIPHLPPATVAADQAILAQVASAAQSVAASSGTTPTTTLGWVKLVEGVVNDVLPFVPAAAPYAPVVAALEGLLPVVLASLGVVGAPMVGQWPVAPLPLPQAEAVLRAQ